MEFELKTLSPDALPRALEKAVRYRLLNEPGEAASICLDVLAADADNQDAAATLLLALTDQFELEQGPAALAEAWECLARIQDEYQPAVLRRHHLGAPRQGPPAPRDAGCRVPRVRMAARGDDVLRAGRSGAAGRQRRRAAAMECVRASDHARPASGAGGRGARRTIIAGIGGSPLSLAKQRELRRGRLVLGDTFI